MATIIRTEYINVNGAGKIRAKGLGKQRTVPIDLSRSTEWNHGAAAGILAKALGLSFHSDIKWDSNDSGTKFGFEF